MFIAGYGETSADQPGMSEEAVFIFILSHSKKYGTCHSAAFEHAFGGEGLFKAPGAPGRPATGMQDGGAYAAEFVVVDGNMFYGSR
jgi:hypothetical protein